MSQFSDLEIYILRLYPVILLEHISRNALRVVRTVRMSDLNDFIFQVRNFLACHSLSSSSSMCIIYSCNILSTSSNKHCIYASREMQWMSIVGLIPENGRLDNTGSSDNKDSSAKFYSNPFAVSDFWEPLSPSFGFFWCLRPETGTRTVAFLMTIYSWH